MADVFVSYKRADRPKVERIVAALEQRGWSVWWDKRIKGGERWDVSIRRELRNARCVIVGWSVRSIDPIAGQYVAAEVQYSLGKKKPVIGVMLERVGIPVPFNVLQCVDFSNWKGSASSHEVNALAQSLPPPRNARKPQPQPQPAKSSGGISLQCLRTGMRWNITRQQFMNQRVIELGRGSNCDIVITEVTVSKRHALIEWANGGGLSIRDLGSMNGTYLDEQRLDETPRRLAGARKLRLGAQELVIDQLPD